MPRAISKAVEAGLPLYKGEDYTGRQFGEWTVLKFANFSGRSYRWTCRCSCGVVKDVLLSGLLYGRTTQCRVCSNNKGSGKDNPNWKGYGKIPGVVLQKIKMSTRKRASNFDVDIDCEYLDKLWDLQGGACVLSGRKLSLGVGTNFSGGNASVDRIDSSKGYVRGNVQWVTIDVNRAKWQLSNAELIQLCKDIVNNQ